MGNLGKPTGPNEDVSMDYARFPAVVQSVFDDASAFEDLTGKDPGAPITHFKCVVIVSDQPVELHLSNPYADHWNCYSEPAMGSEKIVAGASTAQDALADFQAKLGEPEQPVTKEQDANPAADTRVNIDETLTAEQEAEKRGISVEQWRDVRHVIGTVKKVDRDRFKGAGPDLALDNFEFDGGGNIIVPGDLSLDDGGLTHLPKNLKVKGSLSLTSCAGLASLPEGLEVETFVELSFCNGLDAKETLPYLFERLLAGKIKAIVSASWKTDDIKANLPEGLHIDEFGANVIYMDEAILEDGYIEFKIMEAEMMS